MSYERIIQHIFDQHFKVAESGFAFDRDEISDAARTLGVDAPRNAGDLIYTYRSRRELPATIRERAPQGMEWVIRAVGRGQYRFELVSTSTFVPSRHLARTLIPDSTPALIDMYRQSDEQALLAIIRYNRLVDVFTRLSCFSVQSHLRTSLGGIGQVEIDELYVGIDRRGAHYVLPIEVKSASDKLGVPQVENMFALAAERFPRLIARPIGAQFVDDDVIALFEFERSDPTRSPAVSLERHYRLVPAEELPVDVVESYSRRIED